MPSIPFNHARTMGNEFAYIQQALDGMHVSGDGPFTRKCHAYLQQVLGVPKVLLTTSCTHALEMAAILLNVQQGDEVIVPSFTFVSTANAFVLRGARPVFADVRADTLNLDETLLKSLITPRTKAIVPVHYAGVACEMDTILEIARERNIAIVEDNAHGLFGRYQGKALGTLGALGTQSFHETKNCTCGEGGALLINRPDLIERAEIIWQKGTDRSRFFRGQVDKYTWVDIGSSYLPSDILAAFLFAQLEKREQIQARRRSVWESYYGRLQGWAEDNRVCLPVVPPHCQQAYHMFYMILPTPERRDALIEHLKARGIMSVFHYLPLHLSEMGKRFDGQAPCPVTESISGRLVRLPFFYDLDETLQAKVIEAVQLFKTK